MSYINVEECLAKIDEKRINRYNYANIYVGADANTMSLAFAYSDNMEDEFSIIKFEASEMELTEELWQEILCVSKLIEQRFDVERIVDDTRYDSMDDSEVELDSITVTYQIDKCQKRRLQRLKDLFNSIGMEWSLEDTMQAVMSSFTENDVNKNLDFYEVLLLEKEEKANV